MPGLAEGLEGVKAGEMREIRVAFPDRLGPTGGDLEGTKALFEVTALEVKVRLGLVVREGAATSTPRVSGGCPLLVSLGHSP